MQIVKVCFWGLLISFLGSLPLGALNLITTYVTVKNGTGAGFLFAGGCILSELIFVRLALIAMNWISKRQKLFKILECMTIIIILTIAFFSFRAAIRGVGFSRALPANIRYPFWSGVFLSAIDPMKIPFWFLWSTFLMGNNILLPKYNHYNSYVIGIGFGSLFGFMVFIYGGAYLISTINTHQDIVNWVIGGILLITAAIQFYRLLHPQQDKIQNGTLLARN